MSRVVQDHVPVLYADDDLIVVDKPAGLVVHPTYKNADGTLLDILRQRMPEPPSIVGRLDRLTSGIVVVARNSVAHAELQRAMAMSDCQKDYIAFVHGRVADRCTIDLRLRVDPGDRRRVVASREFGAPSLTEVSPIVTKTIDGQSLSVVGCRIVTGRRHQIRVHMAACGWPIVGDPIYGDLSRDEAAAEVVESAPRLALHAWHLEVTHPYSHERLRVTSPLPDDLTPLVRFAAPDAVLESRSATASAGRWNP